MELAVDRYGACVRLTLNGPPLNTLTLETISELGEFFKNVERDRPLIITGMDKAFSAGVDVKAFLSYSADQRKEMFREITRMTAALISRPGPVVAAINGHALGGGLVLALCADYRLAVDGEHKFGLTEARAGVPFPAGPVEIIRHEIAGSLLRHLTLTSRIVSAHFLHEQLVFDELTTPEKLADRAFECAVAMFEQPAFMAVKWQMRGGLNEHLSALVKKGETIPVKGA